MTSYRDTMEIVGMAVDGAGVVVVVIGCLWATGCFLVNWIRQRDNIYREYRQNLGRAILLGLELLVAGDIIRTVAVDPTMENVLVLGMIVAVRTLLSVALEVELEGRWPWRRGDPDPAQPKPRK